MAPAAGSAEVVEEVVASTAVLRDSRASEEHYQKKLEIFASGIGIMQHDLRGEFNAPIDAGGRTAVQLLRHSSDRLSAAYAVGTPIEDIIPLVRQAGQVWEETSALVAPFAAEAIWAQQWLSLRTQKRLAIAAVDLLSWTIALRESSAAAQVLSSVYLTRTGSPMFAVLADIAGVEHRPPADNATAELLHPDLWQRWMDVVNAPNTRARQTAFGKYARGWASGRRKAKVLLDPPPRDISYPGQFAFDLVPLVFRYGVDDSGRRDDPDYPADLVDFGRSDR
jgi:hypothetical protein